MPRKDRILQKRKADMAASGANCKKMTSFFIRSTPDPDPSAPGPSTSKDPTPTPSTSTDPHPGGPSTSASVPSKSKSKSKTKPRITKTHTLLAWPYGDWIEYTERDGVVTKMWCKICKQYSHQTGGAISSGQSQLCNLDSFVEGTNNIKKDTATTHDSSQMHKAAVKAAKQAVAEESGSAPQPPIIRQLTVMSDAAKDKMVKLFDIAYTVAKCEQPFTLFPTLVAMEKRHGVLLGETYQNDVACRNFVGHIAGSMTEELQKSFDEEPFYCSLLFDGSTDKATSEKEVLSIKMIENGLPKIKLLGITEPEKCDANGVYQAILQKCDQMNLDLDNSLVSAAADGAAVNFGRTGGVLTKLQNTQAPWLIKIHCIAHRLELSLKDAFKGTYFTEVDDLMQTLYSFYSRSPKRWSELKKVAAILDTHVVKPARSVGTRWIDHRRKALESLATNYQSIVTQFEEQASRERRDISGADAAKISGLLRKLKSFKFVYFMSFYQDFVDVMARLSKCFQRDDMSVSEVRTSVLLAQSSLLRSTQSPGPHLKQVLDSVEVDTDESHPTITFNWIDITMDTSLILTYRRQVAVIIDDLISSMSERFSSFSDEVLLATEILDPSNYPSLMEMDELLEYGIEEVQTLCAHFQELLVNKKCDVGKVVEEWNVMKLDIVKNHRREKLLPLWQNMLLTRDGRYENILHLIRIILVLPVSSSQVERQFSTIKRFQGDWRLSLASNTVEDLLRICSGGPDPGSFLPAPAVTRWWASSLCTRSRRPNIRPYGPRVAPALAPTAPPTPQAQSDEVEEIVMISLSDSE